MKDSTPCLAEQAIEVSRKWGAKVFPTVPGGKAPAITGGHKAASDDPDEIRRMFAAAPGAGIAINLKASGLVAIDHDAYKLDAEDAAWITRNQAELGCGVVCKTPSGGYHYVFDDDGIERFPGAAGETIDIKHDGYILVAPTPGYEVIQDTDIEPIPSALVAAISEASEEMRRRIGATGTGAMMFASTEEAVEALRQNVEGRRHDALMRITSDLVTDNPGEPVEALVGAAVGMLTPLVKHVEKERRAEILDARAGGELWRLMEGAQRSRGPTDDEAQAILHAVERDGWTAAIEAARRRRSERKVEQHVENMDESAFTRKDLCSYDVTPWLYGGHYTRRRVGVTVAPGGTGKSLLALAEAICMATGRNVLGLQPHHPMRVAYWNGEDPTSEMEKRAEAFCEEHRISNDALGGRLFLLGHAMRLAAADDYGVVHVKKEAVEALRQWIERRSIDVLIVDPFVSSHHVEENSNRQMEVIMDLLRGLAVSMNIAIELVHHSTKGATKAPSADAARGASAIVNAARSVRFLSMMTQEESASARVNDADRADYIHVDVVKTNFGRARDNEFWFQKHSLKLGNPTADYPDGDSVGYITSWRWPSAAAHLEDGTAADVLRVIRDLDKEHARRDMRAKEWAGYKVASVLSADVGFYGIRADEQTTAQRQARLQVQTVIEDLLERGLLKESTYKTFNGIARPYLIVDCDPDAVASGGFTSA